MDGSGGGGREARKPDMADLMMRLAEIRREAERKEPGPPFPWRLVLFVAAALLVLSVAVAGPCRRAGAEPARPREDPKAELRKRVYHVEPAGSLLLASVEIGLVVYDATDPSSPVRVSELEVPGSPISSTARLPHAWVSAGPVGVVVVDLSDPRRPRQVSLLDTPGAANQVAFLGDAAYVADGSMGVAVLDVSDPGRPVEVARTSTEDYARGVIVAGRRLISAEDRAGMRVFDLADPLHPSPVTSVSVPGQVRGVAVDREFAFVAAGTAGVAAVALAPVPRLLWAVRTDDVARGVAVHRGRHLVVADGIAGFKVYAIDDPRGSPRLLSSIRGPEATAARVAVSGDRAYVSFDYAGFLVYDLTEPRTPRLYPGRR